MSSEQQYIDLFSNAEGELCRQSSPVLNALRKKAFDEFCKKGFPSRKDEKYKYTDIEKLFEPDFGLNIKRLDFPFNPYEVFKCDVPNMGTSTFFVVNDSFYNKPLTGHLASRNLPEGVIVGSLKELSRNNASLISSYYGKLANIDDDAITAFNTAFAQDGLFIYIPPKTVVEKPLQVINTLKSQYPLMVNRRVLIVVGDGAQLRLLACDHSSEDMDFLSTQVVEVYVGKSASFDFYELEENNNKCSRISNMYVSQEADSNVLLNCMTLNNGVTRNMLRVYMKGENAELHAYGMAIADQSQRVDNNTYVNHLVPHCTSKQLYKYVLDDKAVGAFAGLVKVNEGAHHTLSEQTNRNICATSDARMYTQPQLEIYNDDVRCCHGATVGQLDETALFYMRQRGIPTNEARLLLMFAFVNEVVDRIRIDALKERLLILVDKRFRGELNKGCNGCSICKRQ